MLVIRLEGALQSWGERSHWDHRDTALMPTKSAVVGMLGCCLGYPRGDERLAALSRAIRIAIRTDRLGRIMTDYHTVHGTDGILRNAQRQKRPGDTIVTPRQYLQDAVFQVFIQSDESTLNMCLNALKSPHWIPFLGRKSCPPAYPLLPTIAEYDSLEDAVRLYPVAQQHVTKTGVLHAEIECGTGETAPVDSIIRTRRDEVVNAQHDRYLSRRVRVIAVQPPVGEVKPCS